MPFSDLFASLSMVDIRVAKQQRRIFLHKEGRQSPEITLSFADYAALQKAVAKLNRSVLNGTCFVRVPLTDPSRDRSHVMVKCRNRVHQSFIRYTFQDAEGHFTVLPNGKVLKREVQLLDEDALPPLPRAWHAPATST